MIKQIDDISFKTLGCYVSIGKFVREYVNSSVSDSIWQSVRDPVPVLKDSVRGSIFLYIRKEVKK